jgi:Ca2+-binding RTX toxin-like protein
MGEGDDLFDQAMSTPIALDLDGDGIERIAQGSNDVFFDIDGDQFAEHVEWVKGDDGFLVRDLNGNGQIDSVAEMFGDNGGTTAYDKLAALDSNSSGTLTSADTAWSTLRVWQDANEDGNVDSGELKTLSELNITSINTSHTSDTVLGGRPVDGTSTFVMNGATRTAADLLLDTDQLNSWFVGDGTAASIEIDPDAMYLPLSRGYGTLPSLHYAMTDDATLKGMVEDFATIDMGSTGYSLYDQLDEILIRWAGAEGISATSRGSFVDGQHLAVLEEIQDQPYYSAAYGGSNPNVNLPAGRLGEAYALFAEEMLERLMVQGPLQTVFPNATYNFAEDTLELGDTLSAVIARASANQPTSGTAAYTIYWNEIGRVVEHHASDLGTTLIAGKAAIDDAAGFVTLPITVAGTAGNDYLGSFDNDDVFRGGAGNDTMMGSGGADLYLFGADSGADIIADASGAQGYDGIRFETLTSSQIALSKTGTGNHDLLVTAAGISETITAQNHYGVNVVGGRDIGDSIQEIQFADGVIWNMATIDNIVENGAAAPTPLTGTTGNNTLTATSTTLNMTGLAGADTFVINQSSSKFVTITDFKPGEDKVDITAFTGISNYSLHLGPQDLLGHATVTIGATGGNIQLNFSGLSNGQLDASDFRSNTLYFGYGQVFGGTSGNDTINGLVANDTIYGNEGADSLNGDSGHDAIYGWTGNDSISAGDGNDLVTGDDGNDQIHGSWGNDSLYGGASADTIWGESEADEIGGDDGNDSLMGDYGDDTIAGGAGLDTINGGNDNDWVDYQSSAAGVTVNLALTGAQTSAGDASGDVLSNIENITGSALADSLSGTSAANILEGLGGNDTLVGGAGADYLDGGSGGDILDYYLSTAGININLTMSTASGGDAQGDTIAGIEHIAATNYNDTLSGSVDNNVIYGFNGNDSITTASGADLLNGGDGNDTLIGGAGADTIVGGNGTDVIDYQGSSSAVTIYLNTVSNSGGDAASDSLSSVENVTGSAFADLLVGDAGANVLNGMDGNDSLLGGAGADTLNGGNGTDYLHYYSSTAAVNINLNSGLGSGGDAAGDSFTGIENVYGSNGYADVVNGNTGNNVIYGFGGDDFIQGYLGNDTVYGGTGNDQFYFGAGHGVDVIQDFEGAGAAGGDLIRLVGLGYSTFAGVQAATTYDFGTSTATITTGSNVITIHGVTTAFISSDFQYT